MLFEDQMVVVPTFFGLSERCGTHYFTLVYYRCIMKIPPASGAAANCFETSSDFLLSTPVVGMRVLRRVVVPAGVWFIDTVPVPVPRAFEVWAPYNIGLCFSKGLKPYFFDKNVSLW